MKFKIDVKCCKCKCSFELAPTSFLKRESAECPNCGQPIPAAEYEALKTGITALGSLPGHIGPDDGGNPFAFAEPVGFDLCVKEDTSAYLHSLEPADEPQS